MNIEQLSAAWGALYRRYGYQSYSMSKFEEYELYLRNKDFLITDRVLTFTDTDGKLMALKPDVTLSIIKNTGNCAVGIQKVYYQEHIYRPGKSDQGFREIPQVGLECMGSVDDYCVLEVLLLAVKSLQAISGKYVLDVSHMGLLSQLLDRCGLAGEARQAALKAIGEKNAHELREVCESADAPYRALTQIALLSGSPAAVMPALEELFPDAPELASFRKLLECLEKYAPGCVNVDFSVINDMKYYNGIVFRGFVEGVPTGVLSGGQYDGLMAKMKRGGKAIGFALYPELLERLDITQQNADVDAVLLYDQDADISILAEAVDTLMQQGISVSVQPGTTAPVRCGRIYKLEGNEVREIGTDA